MTPTQLPSAFWADTGPDTCDFCQVFYYVEVGYHCAQCDSPVCPSCVAILFESQVVLCPECDAEGES